jgi:NADH:ubiquinone oxidoreductase subunit K
MDFVILSLVMIAIGIFGLLTKRNLLKVFVSIELIAVGATLNFVTLAASAGNGLGQAFVILAFSTDTAVSAVILAVLLVIHRKYRTSDITELFQKEKATEIIEEANE